MIKVINIYNCDGAIVGENIMRPTPLSNPYVIGRDGNRMKVLAKYKTHLLRAIHVHDPVVMPELYRLKKIAEEGELNLLCCCKPADCHGDIIKTIIEKMIGASDAA